MVSAQHDMTRPEPCSNLNCALEQRDASCVLPSTRQSNACSEHRWLLANSWAGLYTWRDDVAREEDESPGFVLPKTQLLKLAQVRLLSAAVLLSSRWFGVQGRSCNAVFTNMISAGDHQLRSGAGLLLSSQLHR